MSKGQQAEESLRRYFLSQAFYVVRGVGFRYAGFDITDVDIWLYQRSSVLTRERINVDVKNKKTPQAIERIFWARGLQQALGLDRAFVATTDSRPETMIFGQRNGVTVLGGDFLSQVIAHFGRDPDRLTEEEFLSALRDRFVMREKPSPADLYKSQKALLVSQLDFSGVNTQLQAIGDLLSETLTTTNAHPSTIRLLYVVVSYFLVSIDFAMHHLGHEEAAVREKALVEGLRYGAGGKRRADEVLTSALQLIEASAVPNLFGNRDAIRGQIESEFSKMPVEVLGEQFSTSYPSRRVFNLARAFEQEAFRPEVTLPADLESELRGILGLLLDFFSIDRKRLL